MTAQPIALDSEALARVKRRIRRLSSPPDAKGCIRWLGFVSRTGYGRIAIDKRRINAHRVSFAVANGGACGLGDIDHVCGNRSCINPKHLRQISHRDNWHCSGSPNAVAVRTGRCHRGHEMSGSNVGMNPSGSRYCKTCHRARAAARRSAAKANGGTR